MDTVNESLVSPIQLTQLKIYNSMQLQRSAKFQVQTSDANLIYYQIIFRCGHPPPSPTVRRWLRPPAVRGLRVGVPLQASMWLKAAAYSYTQMLNCNSRSAGHVDSFSSRCVSCKMFRPKVLLDVRACNSYNLQMAISFCCPVASFTKNKWPLFITAIIFCPKY